MLLTYQQARTESERCLSCFDAPCTQTCPVHIDIPGFIAMIKSGNVRGAAEVVKTAHALANICGKVCPEETLCQSVCNRTKQDTPIQIRELHFFASQEEKRLGYARTREFSKLNRNVAVIGAGPAGLGCAFELTKLGYSAEVYDGDGPGGVPKNSIPAFRLAAAELESDINFLAPFVQFKNTHVDASTFENIKKTSSAIFVAVGLGKDRSLGLKGEQLPGVVSVLPFLEKAKLDPKGIAVGDRVVIVGGGNVSLDAAATAKRLGAKEVILIYRRSESEMKVWKSELEEARKQGVEIRFLANPVEFIGRDKLVGVKCRRTKLSEERDSSGRPIPQEVIGSDFVLDAELAIVAIGQVIESDFVNRFERTKQGFVKVDERFQTSERGVFAGGDAIAGEGTIVQSVAHGKQAAHCIHHELTRKQHQ